MEETTRPVEDRLDPARAAALWKVLGRGGPPPGQSDALPALFHHAYFWALDDRSPYKAVLSGKYIMHAPLRLGILANQTTEVSNSGASVDGVTKVRREMRQRGALSVTEDLEVLALGRTEPPQSHEVTQRTAQVRQALNLNSSDLFHHAALTMNPDLRHIDVAAARAAGHSNLLIPAPLLALCLAGTAEQKGPVVRFQYRAHQQTVLGETLEICSDGADLWIMRANGDVVMTAEATSGN